MNQVVIIGAGLIGCAAAVELAARGCDVVIVERDRFGARAASSRAAGILGAQIELHPSEAMSALCLASRERYASWAPRLFELSGIDPGYRVSGVLRLAYDDAQRATLTRELEQNHARGLDATLLSASEARALEPALGDATVAALHFRHDGIVDPPLLLEAARVAARSQGARLIEGRAVVQIAQQTGRVRAAVLDDGTELVADAVVVAAGSWSALVDGLPAPSADTLWPTRGQMFELRCHDALLTRVVDAPDVYLSPRPDGRVLVGSTVERVGFDDAVTAAAAATLLAAALRAVPDLAGARLERSWAGFRAETPDQLPIFGCPGVEGLVVATGHFRNGVLLAPISADIVTALVLGETPPVDLAPFAPERFGA